MTQRGWILENSSPFGPRMVAAPLSAPRYRSTGLALVSTF
jgi:hypothetical protein